MARLRELGREHWAAEDCAALENPRLYEPEPALAWERLRGIAQLDPKPRARAKVLAVWRGKPPPEPDLPPGLVIPRPPLFPPAQGHPPSRPAFVGPDPLPAHFHPP